MSRSETVWIVSEVYDPEPSTGYFIARIAEDIARDRNVVVITRGAALRLLVGKPRDIGSRARPRNVGPLPLRFVDSLLFSIRACMVLIFRGRSGDSMLALTNPPLLPQFVGVAARVKRARLLVLVHDLYPELLAPIGMLRPSSPLIRMLKAAALRLQQNAAVNVVLGRDMRQRLLDRAEKGPAGEIRIIHNWADVARIYPDAKLRSAGRSALAVDREFVVLFSGNMGRTHDLELVLQAARRLASDSGIRFVLMGRGRRFQEISQIVARDRHSNVDVMPACASSELPEYLNAADVYLVPMREGMAGLSVPSRTYNAMAAGLPILAVSEPDSELALVVTEEKAGRVVSPGDPAALASAVLWLRDAPEERASMGNAARRAVEVRYTREQAAGDWRTLLDSIHSRPALHAPAR
jgi:colanic acid biosynthesis glycosyl transferase WcaI